ncbi:hypothetical protein Pth03_14700 [Planotetraspora thailandica]|uniref:ATPase AAA-type core domain-containing protein n=1 Tax=Planotetraspora thailandica TaxID=487172 RepID=A0A8J3UY72_9ACTN|nr:hypothetical protein Pth03_14700 [Planotetraspora thailandica]
MRLRRTAENLSAVIGQMAERDPEQFTELVRLVQALVEHEVTGVEVIRSELNDVMLALREGTATTPAREMSDGLLRFMAIAAALLRKGRDLDLGGRDLADEGRPVTIVIEELENGLHPSQAARSLDLVKRSSSAQDTQVIFTTHSPALLSALDAKDHQSVVVCTRDRDTGLSRLDRLPEVHGYPSLMAKGSLGDIATSGMLEHSQEPQRDFTAFDRLMGLG